MHYFRGDVRIDGRVQSDRALTIPDWVAGNDYRRGDTVLSPRADVVVATVDHASAADFDADSNKWKLLADEAEIPNLVDFFVKNLS